jgi:hypothetical protein
LFYDAFNIVDYIASNERIQMNNEFEGLGERARDLFQILFLYLPVGTEVNIESRLQMMKKKNVDHLETLRKTTKSLGSRKLYISS